MKLLTEELKKIIPPLCSTDGNEEKLAVIKFFDPCSQWTWYVYEGQELEDGDWIFFGYVEGIENEYGEFLLSELESVTNWLGLGIERDLYWEPQIYPIKGDMT
jgi:hypothetical protein